MCSSDLNRQQAMRGNYDVPHTDEDYDRVNQTIAFKPETSWKYEVGTHLNLFDHPSVVHITDLRPGDYLYICSDGMLEQMDNDALCQLFSSQDSDEAKRQQLIEATKGNKDNHSAYFVGIASVSSGEGDESLLDDEQTSKDNALNIRPVFEAEEVASDVEEVSVVEETPRVGQPLRPQPQAPKGGKGKLVLGAAAAFVAPFWGRTSTSKPRGSSV